MLASSWAGVPGHDPDMAVPQMMEPHGWGMGAKAFPPTPVVSSEFCVPQRCPRVRPPCLQPLSLQAFTSGLRRYLRYYRACVLSTPPTLSLLTIGFLFKKLGRQLRCAPAGGRCGACGAAKGW